MNPPVALLAKIREKIGDEDLKELIQINNEFFSHGYRAAVQLLGRDDMAEAIRHIVNKIAEEDEKFQPISLAQVEEVLAVLFRVLIDSFDGAGIDSDEKIDEIFEKVVNHAS